MPKLNRKEFFIMKSVAQKIAITITLLLIIGFFVFSTANFFLAKWGIVNSVTHGKQESVKNAMNFVDAYFDSRITFVQAIAQELVEDGDFSHETISHRLKEAFRLTNIDALFVGYEADGLLIKTDVQSNNKPYILDASKKFDARTREWYKAAKRTMKSGISRPYPDITTGELTAGIYVPIIVDSKLIAVVGANIFLKDLQRDFVELKTTPSSSVFVIGSDERGDYNIVHSDEKILLSEDGEKYKAYSYLRTQAPTEKEVPSQVLHYTYNDVEKMAVCIVSERDWLLCSTNSEKDFESELHSYIIAQSIFSIIIVLVIAIVLYWIVVYQLRHITPITTGLLKFFDFVNHKVNDAPLLAIKSKDEFGIMAQAIDDNIIFTKEAIKQDKNAIAQTLEVVKVIESGDMTARVGADPSNPGIQELKVILNRMLDVLESKIGANMNIISQVFESYRNFDFTQSIPDAKGGVEKTANMLGEEIIQMLRTSSDFASNLAEQSQTLEFSMGKLLQGTNSQASALEQSVSAVGEINASMQNVSQQTSEATSQAQDIRNIVAIIQDIADQTNLLALNAAIEAARAGEHGRGFAVVADSVRQLAERTSKSLGEIEANISVLVQNINDISESINEQTRGLAQINDSINQIQVITHENVEIAKETNSITHQVNTIANAIQKDVQGKKF